MTSQKRTAPLFVGEWPEASLESVPNCPICGVNQRSKLYGGLTDRVFQCASGQWVLYKCNNCRSAFLDPRPSQDSIILAYRDYYTHRAPSLDDKHIQSVHRRLLRALANDYANKRYGTNRQPTNILGRWVIPLLPPLRTPIDRRHRFLPRPSGDDRRLLDVGFGSGEFMLQARQMGYQAMGVDLDPISVSNGLQAGLDVRQGGIDVVGDGGESFDVITINHVIEHLHNPIKALEASFRLLKPGGILYVETPNLESIGHARFRAYWRGLEVPRHLVVFSWYSMECALQRVGFARIEKIERFSPYAGMASGGRALRNGRDPNVFGKLHLQDVLMEIVLGMMANFVDSRTEFIFIRAWKS